MQTQLANTSTQSISAIDSLAMEARALRLSININMWQLARVFAQAKELVPHGEWEKWLRENADVSVRTAQDMMAAYKRFGDNPQFEGLGQAKTFKLLPLPEGTEDKFMAEHDVSAMTTREVQEAVKKAREEAQAAIDAAERRAKAAEINAEEAAEKAANQYADDKRWLEQKLEETEKTVRIQEKMLKDQQRDYDNLQDEILNAKRAVAIGDTEKNVNDEMAAESFAAAVHTFISSAAHITYMADTFSTMRPEDKRAFSVQIDRIKAWLRRAEEAMNTVQGEVITLERQ